MTTSKHPGHRYFSPFKWFLLESWTTALLLGLGDPPDPCKECPAVMGSTRGKVQPSAIPIPREWARYSRNVLTPTERVMRQYYGKRYEEVSGLWVPGYFPGKCPNAGGYGCHLSYFMFAGWTCAEEHLAHYQVLASRWGVSADSVRDFPWTDFHMLSFIHEYELVNPREKGLCFLFARKDTKSFLPMGAWDAYDEMARWVSPLWDEHPTYPEESGGVSPSTSTAFKSEMRATLIHAIRRYRKRQVDPSLGDLLYGNRFDIRQSAQLLGISAGFGEGAGRALWNLGLYHSGRWEPGPSGNSKPPERADSYGCTISGWYQRRLHPTTLDLCELLEGVNSISREGARSGVHGNPGDTFTLENTRVGKKLDTL